MHRRAWLFDQNFMQLRSPSEGAAPLNAQCRPVCELDSADEEELRSIETCVHRLFGLRNAMYCSLRDTVVVAGSRAT